MSHYLVTGCLGQLGRELQAILGDKAEYIDLAELDITDFEAVQAYTAGKNYTAIINCAAYTAVDLAEDEVALAGRINTLGPFNLAATDIPLVHISTDYVFSGTGHYPYTEDEPTDPKSIYGLTKREGEKAAMSEASACFIIRTAWLYSTHGNNFVKTMRRLGAEREELGVICDQIGSPTSATDLAQAIIHLLPLLEPGKKEIYHFSNEGVCSWYDFALSIMELSGLDCFVKPIPSSAYPTKATRPFYSVLDKSKYKMATQQSIPHWRESLAKCIEQLKLKQQ